MINRIYIIAHANTAFFVLACVIIYILSIIENKGDVSADFDTTIVSLVIFQNIIYISYVYWTVHHVDSWIKIDQLDVTCFIISLFTAQHVSNVSTSIFRSLRLVVNHTVTPTHIEPEQYNTWDKSTICRNLLKVDVLTSETCWALNNETKKQVTSSWSVFIQLSRWCTVQ